MVRNNEFVACIRAMYVRTIYNTILIQYTLAATMEFHVDKCEISKKIYRLNEEYGCFLQCI